MRRGSAWLVTPEGIAGVGLLRRLHVGCGTFWLIKVWLGRKYSNLRSTAVRTKGHALFYRTLTSVTGMFHAVRRYQQVSGSRKVRCRNVQPTGIARITSVTATRTPFGTTMASIHAAHVATGKGGARQTSIRRRERRSPFELPRYEVRLQGPFFSVNLHQHRPKAGARAIGFDGN
jgi:hypothetical protein